MWCARGYLACLLMPNLCVTQRRAKYTCATMRAKRVSKTLAMAGNGHVVRPVAPQHTVLGACCLASPWHAQPWWWRTLVPAGAPLMCVFQLRARRLLEQTAAPHPPIPAHQPQKCVGSKSYRFLCLCHYCGCVVFGRRGPHMVFLRSSAKKTAATRARIANKR